MMMYEAINKSEYKLSVRVYSENQMEIAEEGNFYLCCHYQDGNDLIRKPGRGSKKANDWEPVTNPDYVGMIHELQQEEVANEPKDPEGSHARWEDAALESPFGLAYRTTAKDELMVRATETDNWITTGGQKWLTKYSKTYKAHTGWLPVINGHPVAEVNVWEKGVGLIRLKTAADDVETKNKDSAKAYSKSDAPLAEVSPEAIKAGLEMAKILASIYPSADIADKAKIADILIKMTKNIAWQMRDDRNKWS